jgi:hypothetical protein
MTRSNLPIPRTWSWACEAAPRPLGQCHGAPETPGFYELGLPGPSGFVAMYGGMARRSLKARLSRHFTDSHHDEIRRNRDRLWCRFKSLPGEAASRFVESHMIVAYEYPWNLRNEWAGMWAFHPAG